MDLSRSIRAIADAAAAPDGVIDWDAVGEAAKGGCEPGDLRMGPAEREAFADDVRAARDGLRDASGVEFDLPDSVEVQHRHHWIDANVATFERVLRPLEDHAGGAFPGVARSLNTGTMAVTVAFLARNVLGQYDPLLLAEADGDDHGLYFVRPNIRQAAVDLDVGYPRFRRWIAFHEVAHAAEFGAAPWLPGYLEERVEEGIGALSEGDVSPFDGIGLGDGTGFGLGDGTGFGLGDGTGFGLGDGDGTDASADSTDDPRAAFAELNTAMTAVEGYAELLMDRAFDDEYDDLRAKLDARRRGGDPITNLFKRLLGFGMKRRQYERGAAFFAAVADETDLETASLVWERPENLPTDAELDDPAAWIRRVA
ncbi:zinc-dependent metalloprotease [Halobaculum sp. CBA1158]|uniref:zinc-dependent metalloprotease n=1 Tax=Halobaculum sp. CBA1158 TaxID=2904243 RepID=UPI001F19627A|nr:zinc-dependent metalloprotease [Halobaculum sp. CBA1158]UIO98610.1 zinc-dependent metalloprotease [Halobaculum sp. CBA1158]